MIDEPTFSRDALKSDGAGRTFRQTLKYAWALETLVFSNSEGPAVPIGLKALREDNDDPIIL